MEGLIHLIADAMANVERFDLRVSDMTFHPKEYMEVVSMADKGIYEPDNHNLWGALVHCDARMDPGTIKLGVESPAGYIPEVAKKWLEVSLECRQKSL